jgi:hypothetical protein
LRLVREGQLRDRVGEEEQRQEHERRRREHLEEGANRLGPRVQRGDRGADRERQDDQERIGRVDRLLQSLRGDQGHEPRDQDEVGDVARLPAGEPDEQLDSKQEERGQHDEQEREAHDVEPGRAARGEELRVVLQQVEKRLGDGEGPEDGEAEVGPQDLARRRPRGPGFRAVHPRFGRAW